MPQIGTFTREETGFIGHLTTLFLDQDVIIVRAEPSDVENAPDYRVHVFDAMNNETATEIGAGWKRTGERAGEYIAVVIDDPALPQAIRANLFRDDDAGNAWSLHWNGLPSATGRTDAMRSTVLLLLSGLTLACVQSAPSFADPVTTARPSPRDPFADHIAEAAQRFELPAAWIRAVLRAESDGDPRAISPKGAMGLMQLMPETWAEIRVRHRLGDDPYDPHDNIIAGAAYISLLFDRYGSPGWIAAYNAGPGRYEASLKGGSLPAETRAYVASVASEIDRDDAPTPVTGAAVDPFAWTRAPLFIAQRTSKPVTDPLPTERPSNDGPTTPIVRDVSAIAPQSNGLFVARATGGTVQ